jgi:hypothetical protein
MKNNPMQSSVAAAAVLRFQAALQAAAKAFCANHLAIKLVLA